MAFEGDLKERASQSASLRWLEGRLSWEFRLSELRHAVSVVPPNEVAARRAPRPPHPRNADRLSAA